MTRTGTRLAFASSLLMAAMLAACGPVPVDQAERSCLRDAQMASAPRTELGIGVASTRGGDVRPYGSLSFEVSGDYLMGRDPADVFANCVMRRSGQPPSVPLHDQPAWRG
ncbi:hypothetical protein FNJ84_06245 [Paracoccus sp. M683]|uniref:hypothetical protein n=1 Tax=Paracoccus sp. M683 TaxID=2594268 RepID=UPI00117F714D|nr:hypothetical protein [Paracoccus sp. M683]TRW98375.1 hypothetical protein FNJ84_06245 [Paracoccus sp. M683]